MSFIKTGMHQAVLNTLASSRLKVLMRNCIHENTGSVPLGLFKPHSDIMIAFESLPGTKKWTITLFLGSSDLAPEGLAEILDEINKPESEIMKKLAPAFNSIRAGFEKNVVEYYSAVKGINIFCDKFLIINRGNVSHLAMVMAELEI